ncbi:MAG: winged helix-turn-helix domain-containing protein [Candidatus Woesearchaeota archaeon]
MADIFSVFFREKPAKMLIEMRRTTKKGIYASNIAKAVDCTYSHVVKILQQMEKSGLVAFNKQGRLKYLTLTKKGEEVANYIDKISQTLKE